MINVYLITLNSLKTAKFPKYMYEYTKHNALPNKQLPIRYTNQISLNNFATFRLIDLTKEILERIL